MIEIIIIWLVWVALLSWPLYAAIVDNAATDNLTELMREGGTFMGSSTLAIGFLAFYITGSAFSKAIAIPNERKKLLICALFSTLISITCFWIGSEEIIVKYGKVFSAWQFLLSTDRQNYATGFNLYMRFTLIYCATISVYALAQTTSWKQARM